MKVSIKFYNFQKKMLIFVVNKPIRVTTIAAVVRRYIKKFKIVEFKVEIVWNKVYTQICEGI
jgi:hypothetical protein